MRSHKCTSPSFRISVSASNARSMGVVGSLELNKTGLSLTVRVSTALVISVLLNAEGTSQELRAAGAYRPDMDLTSSL